MLGSSNDGPNEVDAIVSAVQSVAGSAGIDPSGKVHPIIGDYGLSFGLFQVQIPNAALCTGYAKNECPSSVITNMVENGIYGHNGTSSPPERPGIAYWMSQEGGNVGRALRGYNTGHIDDPNDLTDINVGTKSYVSDVANRLVGGLLGATYQATCS
ncbi:MAG: hypothetical protein Q9201_004566 [Fulgogasparrea decipioides]